MITNREKRIQYLGFDDKWFVIIGILLLGLAAMYVFNVSTAQLTTIELTLTIVASYSFRM